MAKLKSGQGRCGPNMPDMSSYLTRKEHHFLNQVWKLLRSIFPKDKLNKRRVSRVRA